MNYVFIAQGIGITPFRSMIKYVTDKKVATSMTLFFIANKKEDFIFKDIFEDAEKKINLKTQYVLSELNGKCIQETIKDISEPIFYISGPQHMVETYRDLLEQIGVKQDHIKTDLFTGY